MVHGASESNRKNWKTDRVPVSVTSPGSAVARNVHSNFYLGGVRQLSNVNPNAVDNDPSFVQDFTGCIDHFEVCVQLVIFNTFINDKKLKAVLIASHSKLTDVAHANYTHPNLAIEI